MAGIIERVGPCLLAAREPTFETLARSITFQQLHGKAAGTIFERVRKAVGRRFTATALLKLSPEDLRACGLSRQKIASLTDLAERVARREINFSKLANLPDEEIIELLSQVRGVGVWTVQMFLLFALERPNVMPLDGLWNSKCRAPSLWARRNAETSGTGGTRKEMAPLLFRRELVPVAQSRRAGGALNISPYPETCAGSSGAILGKGRVGFSTISPKRRNNNNAEAGLSVRFGGSRLVRNRHCPDCCRRISPNRS